MRWLVKLHGGQRFCNAEASTAKAGAYDKKVWKIVETTLTTFFSLVELSFSEIV